MFSTDFIFRQQENLVDNQKCQAGFRQLCNKILISLPLMPVPNSGKEKSKKSWEPFGICLFDCRAKFVWIWAI